MNRLELQQRTRKFHINVIKLCDKLPKTVAGFKTADQLIRAAGSVGSNYRATARAKSTKDFANKLKIIIEEADESKYWLEIIRDTPLITDDVPFLNRLIQESDELTAIFVASSKTINKNNKSN